MKFILEIDCKNAAFHDDEDLENQQAARDQVALILRDLAKHLEHGADYRTLLDTNGNRVGVGEFKH